MKVAVLGKTLFSGVISALLSECGHQVVWCNSFSADEPARTYFQDESLQSLLHKQEKSGFLNCCDFQHLDFNQDVFFFSFNATEEQQAFQMLDTIRHACFAHPKLMINASTFGLHGTQRFQQLLPNDDWIYLPDIIQEGNALRSFTQATQLIVGCDHADIQLKIKELLRPLFPRAQQYLFMPVLDAEFTKLSISGMLATRISYMNDLASVAEKLGISQTHLSNMECGRVKFSLKQLLRLANLFDCQLECFFDPRQAANVAVGGTGQDKRYTQSDMELLLTLVKKSGQP